MLACDFLLAADNLAAEDATSCYKWGFAKGGCHRRFRGPGCVWLRTRSRCAVLCCSFVLGRRIPASAAHSARWCSCDFVFTPGCAGCIRGSRAWMLACCVFFFSAQGAPVLRRPSRDVDTFDSTFLDNDVSLSFSAASLLLMCVDRLCDLFRSPSLVISSGRLAKGVLFVRTLRYCGSTFTFS